MTEIVKENNNLPEITVSDEEDALILELRADIKFLREALTLALKNQQDSGKVVTRISPLPGNLPVETVITDFNEAKDYLENHFYQEALKAKSEKEKNNGANPKA